MSAWLARGALLGAGGCLAAAAIPAEAGLRWSLLAAVSIILGLWLGSYFTRLERLPTAGVAGMVVLAGVALYFGLNATLVLIALLLAMLAWDLDLFARRLRGFARIEGGVVARHLRATAIVGLITLGLLLLGLHISSGLSFWPALLLAAASFASLVALLRLASA
jgi:phage shock protein PspC (stress-responsive transcriptional regulator)